MKGIPVLDNTSVAKNENSLERAQCRKAVRDDNERGCAEGLPDVPKKHLLGRAVEASANGEWPAADSSRSSEPGDRAARADDSTHVSGAGGDTTTHPATPGG